MITFGSFMGFWGYIFLGSTLWVAVARGDEHTPITGTVWENCVAAYKEMALVLRLPAVRSLSLVLLTCKAAMGVFDAVAPLKLIKSGFPKESIAAISSALFPIGILSQLYISATYFADNGGKSGKQQGTQALSLWVSCYPTRLLLGASVLAVILVTPSYAATAEGLPAWLYAIVAVLSAVGLIASGGMFVAQMAFYNRVADPAIGGTYMTMLNTISNLGSMYPATAALYIVGKTDGLVVGGFVVDGFVITVLTSLVVGVLWYASFRKRVVAIERLPPSHWVATAK